MSSRLDLDLYLDLEVFVGPFDLLLTVLLREEVDLLELELAEVAAAYVTKLEESGEIELEVATEFLVLIAALLELKSRLMLPSADDELAELGPEEAVDELVARMLEYRRFRDAGQAVTEIFEQERGHLHRSAPLPSAFRRVAVENATQAYRPEVLGEAIGELLEPPARPDLSHLKRTVSLRSRLSALRAVLEGDSEFDFDERFGREDRLTQAVTILALLQLHTEGEAEWSQEEICGPITISNAAAGRGKTAIGSPGSVAMTEREAG